MEIGNGYADCWTFEKETPNNLIRGIVAGEDGIQVTYDKTSVLVSGGLRTSKEMIYGMTGFQYLHSCNAVDYVNYEYKINKCRQFSSELIEKIHNLDYDESLVNYSLDGEPTLNSDGSIALSTHGLFQLWCQLENYTFFAKLPREEYLIEA